MPDPKTGQFNRLPPAGNMKLLVQACFFTLLAALAVEGAYFQEPCDNDGHAHIPEVTLTGRRPVQVRKRSRTVHRDVESADDTPQLPPGRRRFDAVLPDEDSSSSPPEQTRESRRFAPASTNQDQDYDDPNNEVEPSKPRRRGRPKNPKFTEENYPSNHPGFHNVKNDVEILSYEKVRKSPTHLDAVQDQVAVENVAVERRRNRVQQPQQNFDDEAPEYQSKFPEVEFSSDSGAVGDILRITPIRRRPGKYQLIGSKSTVRPDSVQIEHDGTSAERKALVTMAHVEPSAPPTAVFRRRRPPPNHPKEDVTEPEVSRTSFERSRADERRFHSRQRQPLSSEEQPPPPPPPRPSSSRRRSRPRPRPSSSDEDFLGEDTIYPGHRLSHRPRVVTEESFTTTSSVTTAPSNIPLSDDEPLEIIQESSTKRSRGRLHSQDRVIYRPSKNRFEDKNAEPKEKKEELSVDEALQGRILGAQRAEYQRTRSSPGRRQQQSSNKPKTQPNDDYRQSTNSIIATEEKITPRNRGTGRKLSNNSIKVNAVESDSANNKSHPTLVRTAVKKGHVSDGTHTNPALIQKVVKNTLKRLQPQIAEREGDVGVDILVKIIQVD